ncbi:MAG: ISH3 family transposase, partial [Candidatus Methanogaster sp.]
MPEGAEYSAEDATNVLLHAATSSSNSIESAVQDLQAMHPISRIPCADTVHTYVKENDIDEMMSFYRKMNSEFIDMVNISDSPQDIAIDFHNVPYYGDKNTKGVVGIQPKNG